MGKSNYNFKKLHPFKWFILQNYPFLEDSIDVLTNYQLFCKLGELINNQVAPINEMGEQVETLTDSFNDLYDWFENLDVQDEINNKLDEMAESGELEEIMAHYLQTKAVFGFNNVAEMKSATNLITGSFVQTYGYYSANDGGKALYKIRNVTNLDIENDVTIIALSDENLVAELILEKDVNVEVLGITKDSSDKYSNISYIVNKGVNLLFTKGEYQGNISIDGNLNVKFIDSSLDGNSNDGLVIKNANNCKIDINLKNCNNGLVIEDSDDIKAKVNIVNCNACGVLVKPTTKNCENIEIKGYVENSGLTSAVSPAVYFNSGDTYIVKNSIIECDVKNAGYVGLFPGGDNNKCVNCFIDGSGVVTETGASGIWVHDSGNIVIDKCNVTNCKRQGISVNKSVDVTITNCNCYHNYFAGIFLAYDGNATGRYQGDNANKNITISNCNLYNNSYGSAGVYDGITVNGSKNVIVSNCIAYDNQATQTQSRGFVCLNNANTENIVVNDCLFKGNKLGSGIFMNDYSKLTYSKYYDATGIHTSYNGKSPYLCGSAILGAGNTTSVNYIDANTVTTSQLASYVFTLVTYLKNIGII